MDRLQKQRRGSPAPSRSISGRNVSTRKSQKSVAQIKQQRQRKKLQQVNELKKCCEENVCQLCYEELDSGGRYLVYWKEGNNTYCLCNRCIQKLIGGQQSRKAYRGDAFISPYSRKPIWRTTLKKYDCKRKKQIL